MCGSGAGLGKHLCSAAAISRHEGLIGNSTGPEIAAVGEEARLLDLGASGAQDTELDDNGDADDDDIPLPPQRLAFFFSSLDGLSFFPFFDFFGEDGMFETRFGQLYLGV